MKISQIIVLKETREKESRVALTPKEVGLLVSKNYCLIVESQAGANAGFTDQDYVNAGAQMVSTNSKMLPANSLILRVKRARKEQEALETKFFNDNTAMIGFLDPLDPSITKKDDHISTWQMAGISTFALELLKLSPNDPRSAQAAMSRIAGKLALKDALKHYRGKLPIKVTVIGAGPAAYNAALEAKQHGLPVQVFGRKENHRGEFEAAGITYQVLPERCDPVAYIQRYLSDQTIVIAAVRSPGVKSAVLLNQESLRRLPNESVLIDLAAGEGGNIVGSKSDQIVEILNGIKIVNVSGYPKAEPHLASQAFAQCVFNLLEDVLSPQGELLLSHELLKSSWLTHQGKRNPLF